MKAPGREAGLFYRRAASPAAALTSSVPAAARAPAGYIGENLDIVT